MSKSGSRATSYKDERRKRASKFLWKEGDIEILPDDTSERGKWETFRGQALFYLLDVRKPGSGYLPVRGSPLALATAIRLVSPKAWADFIKLHPEYPLAINKANYPESYPPRGE